VTRLLVAFLVLTLAACGDDAGTTIDPNSLDGEAVYQEACIACHGRDGEGIEGFGRPLAQSEYIASKTDEEIFDVIVEGRSANDPENTSGVAMAPRGGFPDLSDAEVRTVITYLRTLQAPGG